jgi:hypothetical protein
MRHCEYFYAEIITTPEEEVCALHTKALEHTTWQENLL